MDSPAYPSDQSILSDPGVVASQLIAAVSPVFDVDSIRHPKAEPSPSFPFGGGAAIELSGRLRLPSDQAYPLVAERFRLLGFLAVFRKAGGDDVVLAVPGRMPAERVKPWLAIALFVATALSVLYVGSAGEEGSQGVLGILAGWPFAVSLLSILMAHEFGHYVVSRHVGTPVSLPYFIPLPLPPFGTMGAVIRMRGLPRNRRTLLAVAVAGPLAGLVVAIPVLFIGLRLSTVGSLPPGSLGFQEGNSLLYAVMKLLVFGRFLPAGGQDVLLHPVALAGWAGLLVTAMNLIPAAQLDGGHIARALFGGRAQTLTWAIVVCLVLLGIFWTGWFLWAVLVLVFGRFQVVLLDGITSLRDRERWIAVLMLAVFVLVFVPIPMTILG